MGVTVGTTLTQSCHPQKSKRKSIAQTFFHLINMQGRTHLVPFPSLPLNTLLQLLKHVARHKAQVVAQQLLDKLIMHSYECVLGRLVH